jgi:hypothetical protein
MRHGARTQLTIVTRADRQVSAQRRSNLQARLVDAMTEIFGIPTQALSASC